MIKGQYFCVIFGRSRMLKYSPAPFGDDQRALQTTSARSLLIRNDRKPSAAPSDARRASSVFVEGNDSNRKTLWLEERHMADYTEPSAVAPGTRSISPLS